EPGVVSRQQVHRGEARPLTVRDEQFVRLLRLDPPPAQVGEQLDEAEIARETAFEAAEALEADDADRPRAEAAFAAEPECGRVGRHAAQPLEVERPAEADQRAGAARAE